MRFNATKFRVLGRLSFVFMILAIVPFFGLLIVWGILGLGYGMVAMFVFGGTAVMLECAAYDNIICPMCGQRLVTPLRESFTKENRKRFAAIYKGLPIKCIHCGKEVETK